MSDEPELPTAAIAEIRECEDEFYDKFVTLVNQKGFYFYEEGDELVRRSDVAELIQDKIDELKKRNTRDTVYGEIVVGGVANKVEILEKLLEEVEE